jgi:hypothetical protein
MRPRPCWLIPDPEWLRWCDHVHMAWRIALVVGAAVFLVWGTILVFLAFDRYSHSASDTLRPFIITMSPVWVVAVLAGGELITTGARKR